MWGCGYYLFGPEYGPTSGYYEQGHKYSGPLNSWNCHYQKERLSDSQKKKFLI